MEQELIPMGGKPAMRTGRRTMALILFFATALSYLGLRIFCLQVFGYESAQGKVLDEITVSSTLRAKRGDILDANGNVLATSRTVYRIYISPKNIARREKEDGRAYAEEIASGLSSLLGLSRESILKKTEKYI